MLLTLENFTDFSAANLDGVASFGGTLTIVDGPRSGSKALQQVTTNQSVTWAVPGIATIRFSFAVRFSSAFTSKFCWFSEGSDHVSLGANSGGALLVHRAPSSLLDTSDDGVFVLDQWTHLEGRIVIHDSSGSVEIRANGGAAVINLTGADTQNGQTGVINSMSFGGAGSGRTVQIADLAVWSEDGEAPTGWLGHTRIDTLLPSAAGGSTQWTPSSGDNYACVDETNTDDDSTYVESATNDHKDLYSLGNLSHSPTAIHAVAVTARAKKTDSGSGAVKLVMKSGSTEAIGSSEALTENEYKRFFYARGIDPDTSGAWSVSAVNALEAGIKAVI